MKPTYIKTKKYETNIFLIILSFPTLSFFTNFLNLFLSKIWLVKYHFIIKTLISNYVSTIYHVMQSQVEALK